MRPRMLTGTLHAKGLLQENALFHNIHVRVIISFILTFSIFKIYMKNTGAIWIRVLERTELCSLEISGSVWLKSRKAVRPFGLQSKQWCGNFVSS